MSTPSASTVSSPTVVPDQRTEQPWGGARAWLATGRTDMRKGMNGLALQVQEVLERDPHSGHLFAFRGRRGDLIKILWHDDQGMCLFVKRLERGR